MKTSVVVVLALLAVGAFILAGCGGGDEGPAGRSGTVQVLLTDVPLSDVTEVHVHIVRIELVSEGEGPVVLLTDDDLPDDIELIALSQQPMPLGEPLVEPGSYNQVRLILSDEVGANWILDGEGVRHDLTVPSGAQTGAKLVTGQFEVVAEQMVTLLIDFNAAASVHQAGASGQWIMRPTISAAVVSADELDFAAISGTVLDEEGNPLEVPEGELLGVFIETPLGALEVAEVDPESGEFQIPAILAGAYDLKIMYADADWNPVGDPLQFHLEGEADLLTALAISLEADEVLELSLVVATSVE
ncbi:MAG: DUF4382 domain-containing protein [Armatimonadota bacterium]|nr:DUF4382 domain-containing protein [Armatimonadota bacterium]